MHALLFVTVLVFRSLRVSGSVLKFCLLATSLHSLMAAPKEQIEATIHQFQRPRIVNMEKYQLETAKYQHNYCEVMRKTMERNIAKNERNKAAAIDLTSDADTGQSTTEGVVVVVVDLTKDH